MRQPEGFVRQGAKDKVCILNKALYGLSKQAGHGKKDYSKHSLRKAFTNHNTNHACGTTKTKSCT
jgi:hypothetical protein